MTPADTEMNGGDGEMREGEEAQVQVQHPAPQPVISDNSGDEQPSSY